MAPRLPSQQSLPNVDLTVGPSTPEQQLSGELSCHPTTENVSFFIVSYPGENLAEDAKLKEVPYFGWGEANSPGRRQRRACIWWNERQNASLSSKCHPHPLGRIRVSGHPLPYVLTLLSRQNPTDTSKSDDEVLNCRKAIWGVGSVGLAGMRHFVFRSDLTKIKAL